jgi:hypothetical protein
VFAKRQNLRLVALALLAAARVAAADCPQGQTAASCALHDEGVAAFTAGKYDDAATKFRAAIAAGPTARSYLGYSQSVEGQGKIALAYETMLVAQKLSNEEMAKPGASSDATLVGRAERIKYKLAELGAKIAYVWLRLPEGVAQSRVVSVFREGEGDLASPIGRWIVVAPNKQVMYATLDDGSRVQVVAGVAAGSQGTVVIPIVATQRPAVQPVPVQQPFVPPTPIVQPPREEPFDKKPSPNPPNIVFALDAAFIARDAGDNGEIGLGLGFGAIFEKKLNKRIALVGRAALVFHPSREAEVSALETSSTNATEGLILVGGRTRSKLPLYGAIEAGVLIFNSRTVVSLPGTEDRETDYAHTYPAVLIGGGVRLGKVHLEVGALAVANTGDFDLPARFFATFGVDLLRR